MKTLIELLKLVIGVITKVYNPKVKMEVDETKIEHKPKGVSENNEDDKAFLDNQRDKYGLTEPD